MLLNTLTVETGAEPETGVELKQVSHSTYYVPYCVKIVLCNMEKLLCG